MLHQTLAIAVRTAGTSVVDMYRTRPLGSWLKDDGSPCTRIDLHAAATTIDVMGPRRNLLYLYEDVPESMMNRMPFRFLPHSSPIVANGNDILVCDPIDGTKALIEGGAKLQRVGISLALIQGGVPTLGAVCLPFRGITIAADDQVCQNGSAPLTAVSDPAFFNPVVAANGCRDPEVPFEKRVITPLFGKSAACDRMPPVAGIAGIPLRERSLYISYEQSIWDVAGAWRILETAGGASCAIDLVGETIYYSRTIPWDRVEMPPMLFARNAAVLKAALSEIGAVERCH